MVQFGFLANLLYPSFTCNDSNLSWPSLTPRYLILCFKPISVAQGSPKKMSVITICLNVFGFVQNRKNVLQKSAQQLFYLVDPPSPPTFPKIQKNYAQTMSRKFWSWSTPPHKKNLKSSKTLDLQKSVLKVPKFNYIQSMFAK